MTDHELQLAMAMAKALPTLICHYEDKFYWTALRRQLTGLEWLHLMHEAEKPMHGVEWMLYKKLLREQLADDAINASWQQRAEAFLKVNSSSDRTSGTPD